MQKICPICEGTSFLFQLNCKDHSLTQETFSLYTCNHCGLSITFPQPEEENLQKYYDFKEYISHNQRSTSLLDRIYYRVRKYTIRRKIKLIQSLNNLKKQTILDVGCGTGSFLESCQQINWDCSGIESSDTARAEVEKIPNIKLYKKINEVKGVNFSIITLWHVLEHLTEPMQRINDLSKLLDKEGHLIIALPNLNSYDARKYKSFWAGYDVPRHLWHFSKPNIERLLAQSGLKLIHTYPMYFDSFYVSLLSEKYMNKNKLTITGISKALISGLMSNLKAYQNNEYSSLIYIASK